MNVFDLSSVVGELRKRCISADQKTWTSIIFPLNHQRLMCLFIDFCHVVTMGRLVPSGPRPTTLLIHPGNRKAKAARVKGAGGSTATRCF